MSYGGHPDQLFGHISYSQHGEDLVILNLFKHLGIKTPSYLDIGAHHPTDISNTKLLYDRGSRGINIEANPNLIDIFKKERPGDTNLNFGIGLESGEKNFFMYSNTSGRNTFSELEVRSLEGVLKVKTSITLPMVPLKWVVDSFCNKIWPHFLSMDIEGLDYAVLEQTHFEAVDGPWVVCVETRRNESTKMIKLFETRGYFAYCRMGENLLFTQTRFKELVF